MGVQVAHTADLDPSVLRAARALCQHAFGDGLTEHAWDHALGGLHALIWESGELVAHASVIQRRLVYRGRTLRAGYLECVAVRADRRRRGLGGALMAEAERVIHAAYSLGALSATDDGAALYAARGWQRWQGELWALGPAGPVRTASAARDVFVLPVAGLELDVDERLTCDWREGDVW